MVTWRPPLPEWPPVPTAPMGLAGLAQVRAGLATCRKLRRYPDAVQHAQHGLARLWIHLALGMGLDPRRLAGTSSQGHASVLAAYLPAAAVYDDRACLMWDAHLVATLASQIWSAAKSRQLPTVQPGLGLDLDL